MALTELTQVVLVAEEISELRRLAGDERFTQWSKVYEVEKSGLEGKEAIARVNAELDEANHVDEKTYRAICRAIRERSVTLRINKDLQEVHPFVTKLNDKLDMILKTITEEDIKKAGLKDRAFAWGIFFDKLRLLENKSTENKNLIVHGKAPEAMRVAVEENKKLREDLDVLVAFAKKHGLTLPDDEAFRKKMLQTGELFSYGADNSPIPPSIETEGKIIEEDNAAPTA